MSFIFSAANKPLFLRFISHCKCLNRKYTSYNFRISLPISQGSLFKCRVSTGKSLNVHFSTNIKLNINSLGVIQSYGDKYFYSSSSSFRTFHTTSALEDSKVEDTLQAIKENIKCEKQKKEQVLKIEQEQTDKTTAIATADANKDQPIATTSPKDFTFIEAPIRPPSTGTNIPADAVKINLIPQEIVSYKPPLQLSLATRFVNELKHYYHGFRLLAIDTRVALRLIWAVLNGKTLLRREKKQLVRTTADLFRLVPFLVFILIPFAEFALPVVLKFFPGMLPSTFKEANAELEKKRKSLKLKLELAKFLQDTIEETALHRKGAKGESVHEFARFMEGIRSTGAYTSNTDIIKFSKLFEDEITLDNLSTSQLRAMCKLLEIKPVISSSIMRFQLEMKLRDLKADDKMIQNEGVDSMAVWELQEACRQRGMRSFGVPEGQLRQQLQQWLDLHLNLKIPPSLLLLSRTLFFHERISTEDKLKATIRALPATLDDEAKVKISEVSGDRIDNKSKLEVIKQEEELIRKEKHEIALSNLKLKEKQAKEEAATTGASGVAAAVDAAGLGHLPSLDKIISKDEIHTRDLEEFEEALEMVVDSKLKLHSEVAELRELKDEFVEYRENLDQIKEVVGSANVDAVDKELSGLQETKAAKRLTKKVESMIEKLNKSVEKLSAEKGGVVEGAVNDAVERGATGVVGGGGGGSDGVQPVPTLEAEKLIEKQAILITVNELMIALKGLKKDDKSSGKLELITSLLDKDQDGLIDYTEVTKLLKIIGDEDMRMDSEQVTKIMATLEKEKEVLEAEKLQKQQEQLLQQMKQQPEQQHQQLQHQQQVDVLEDHVLAGSVEQEREFQKLEEARLQHRQKQLLKQQDATIYDQILLQKEKLELQKKQLQQENKVKPQ